MGCKWSVLPLHFYMLVIEWDDSDPVFGNDSEETGPRVLVF